MGQKQRQHLQRRALGPTLRPLYDAAKAAGWRIELTGGDHVRWYPPDGGRPVVSALTPSDHRAAKNTRAYLRRSGLDV